MTYFHPAWLEHQRKRDLRADAYRFAPPGTPEAEPPGWLDPSATRVRLKEAQEEEARRQAAAAQEEFERKLAQLRASHERVKQELAEINYELAWRKFLRKYSPSQPRVPAGNADGGQWTSGGGGSGGIPASGSDGEVLSDESLDPIRPGAQYVQDTSKRYSVNLDEDEGPRGIGHTLREHVGKSDAELIGKLNDEWRRWQSGRFEITEYRPAQGSFLSRESANDLVNRTLEDNKETVDRVASGQQIQATLEKRVGYVTGKEAYRSTGDAEPHIRSTYGVRMVIRHDLRSERGYRVYTAFPVNEDIRRRR